MKLTIGRIAILTIMLTLVAMFFGLKTNPVSIKTGNEISNHNILTIYGHSLGVDWQNISSLWDDKWNVKDTRTYYSLPIKRNAKILPKIGNMALLGNYKYYFISATLIISIYLIMMMRKK
jgi:hypothetical protein